LCRSLHGKSLAEDVYSRRRQPGELCFCCVFPSLLAISASTAASSLIGANRAATGSCISFGIRIGIWRLRSLGERFELYHAVRLRPCLHRHHDRDEEIAIQNRNGLACCTCGSARTLVSTSAGSSPVNLDQRDGIGAWRLAADMEGGDVDAGIGPRSRRTAMKPGLSRVGDVDHRGGRTRHPCGCLDVDDARSSVGVDGAGYVPRLAIGSSL